MQMISHDGVLALYDSFIEMRQRPALGVFITERVDGTKVEGCGAERTEARRG
jgi:hypothetical protein